ncbi:MAG: hypothetical protein QOJ29_1533 [Thermoleophilaceae bacterium]|jgi:hypothetical protein|nr:hypothetical protein [Thermoleophilaceae bacterium]
MLEPRCTECGGLLESVPAQAAAVTDRSVLRIGAPAHLSPAFGRILRFVLVALLLFAAARFGWGAGGAGLAIAAVGVVGLFTVPLIVGE